MKRAKFIVYNCKERRQTLHSTVYARPERALGVWLCGNATTMFAICIYYMITIHISRIMTESAQHTYAFVRISGIRYISVECVCVGSLLESIESAFVSAVDSFSLSSLSWATHNAFDDRVDNNMHAKCQLVCVCLMHINVCL